MNNKDMESKKRWVRDPYHIINGFDDDGESKTWCLEWCRVDFKIDHPKFTKNWFFANHPSPDYLPIQLNSSEDSDSSDEDPFTRDLRLMSKLRDQVEFEDGISTLTLTGWGKADWYGTIETLHVDEGLKCQEKSRKIIRNALITIVEQKKIGVGEYWNEESDQWSVNPYVRMECYVPLGVIAELRDELFSSKSTQAIRLTTQWLLWKKVRDGWLDPDHYHMMIESGHVSEAAIVSSINAFSVEGIINIDTEAEEDK